MNFYYLYFYTYMYIKYMYGLYCAGAICKGRKRFHKMARKTGCGISKNKGDVVVCVW